MKRILLALGLLAAPAGAQTIDAPRMTDPELARERGGFSLPGGIIVTLGVTTDTRVDGQEVLRTVFSIENGAPKLAVLSAAEGETALKAVDLKAGGVGISARDGVLRLRQSGGEASRVELSGDRLDITHLVGRGALGSVVVNAADNRTIDVATSVDIGLSGVRPDQIGSAAARVDTLALEATTQLVR